MRLAVVEFNQLNVNGTGPTEGGTYVECRLIDPPIDFAIGVGNTVSEAFANMQSRVMDTAIYSARLLHDDPDEWKLRSEQQQLQSAHPICGSYSGKAAGNYPCVECEHLYSEHPNHNSETDLEDDRE